MKIESFDSGSRNRMMMQRTYQRPESLYAVQTPPPPPPIRESNCGPRTAATARRGNTMISSPGKSLFHRRNIEPLSPISLNSMKGFVRHDGSYIWATPTKQATDHYPTPTTVATKAAIAKIQSGKCKKMNAGMVYGKSFETTLLEKQEKENGIPMNNLPKALESNASKFSPEMRNIISKYGYQTHQGCKTAARDTPGSGIAIPPAEKMIGEAFEKPKRENSQEPIRRKPSNHYYDRLNQENSNKPSSSFFATSKNHNAPSSTTALTLSHDRLMRGKELAKAAAKRNIKPHLGATTIGSSKSMELESDYDRSFVDTTMIAPSKSTEAYDEEKHGMQSNVINARSPSVLFDRKKRAQLIASHRQRRASSTTRGGTIEEGNKGSTIPTAGVGKEAGLPPKVERGRSSTRRVLDAGCNRVKQGCIKNDNFENESTARGRSVSSAVRLRMQMQNDAKRANAAAAGKASLLPPSRGRDTMEPVESSSVHSKWSTSSSIYDRRRSSSVPRDLTQVYSDLTDDASYGFDVSQNRSFMSDEQKVAQQRRRQKARSMMARRRKFIVHQVDSDTA
ncbi:hypothetical protein ACHAXS_013063 [Conticribra weissflogii]